MPEPMPCPDCGFDPDDPPLHRGDCPRVNTCGQVGPPWPPPPFHRWRTTREPEPPGVYLVGTEKQHRAEMHPDDDRDYVTEARAIELGYKGVTP